jgi:hypothetical protein
LTSRASNVSFLTKPTNASSTQSVNAWVFNRANYLSTSTSTGILRPRRWLLPG